MNSKLPALAMISLAVFIEPVQIAAQTKASKKSPAAKAKGTAVAKSTAWAPPRLPDGVPTWII